jgi:hypothetical protein
MILFAPLFCYILFAAAQAPTPSPTPAPTKKTETAPAPAPAFTLTELQHAHLHEAQLTFFLTAKDEQKALDDFFQACNQVAIENHWPAGTKCNVQDLSVIPPGGAPQQPAVKKK